MNFARLIRGIGQFLRNACAIVSQSSRITAETYARVLQIVVPAWIAIDLIATYWFYVGGQDNYGIFMGPRILVILNMVSIYWILKGIAEPIEVIAKLLPFEWLRGLVSSFAAGHMKAAYKIVGLHLLLFAYPHPGTLVVFLVFHMADETIGKQNLWIARNGYRVVVIGAGLIYAWALMANVVFPHFGGQVHYAGSALYDWARDSAPEFVQEWIADWEREEREAQNRAMIAQDDAYLPKYEVGDDTVMWVQLIQGGGYHPVGPQLPKGTKVARISEDYVEIPGQHEKFVMVRTMDPISKAYAGPRSKVGLVPFRLLMQIMSSSMQLAEASEPPAANTAMPAGPQVTSMNRTSSFVRFVNWTTELGAEPIGLYVLGPDGLPVCLRNQGNACVTVDANGGIFHQPVPATSRIVAIGDATGRFYNTEPIVHRPTDDPIVITINNDGVNISPSK